MRRPTFSEVDRALSNTGRYHFPAEPALDLHWPVAPATEPLRATAVTAERGDYYVTDLDSGAAAAYALDPLKLVEFKAAIGVSFGVANVAALRARYGFLPGIFKAPPNGGTVTFSPHGKIVVTGGWGGSAAALVETFSFSMSYDVAGPDVGAMPNTLPDATLTAVANEWAAFIGKSESSGPAFSSEVWCTEVAYYRAKADGQSTTGTWQRHFLSPAVQGTVTTSHSPLQVACVATLDGLGARKGRFGRFYMPPPALQTALGSWSGTSIADLLADLRTTLAAINDELSAVIDGDVELVIASGIGSGENRPVRSLRIGVVPDTQRRRRRSLDENYQVLPFQSV